MGFDASPEPEPEFEMTREEWGAAWPIHIYTFFILFLVFSVYNINSIIGLCCCRKGEIRRKKIFLLTNIMLFFFNFITAVHLIINPYESHEHFRIKLPGLLFIFFGLRLPCLTAAFSFILTTLIETTKMKLYSKKLQNIWYLTGIIVVHFTVVVAVHFYLVFNADEFQVIAVCQMFFILFGTVVSCTIIYCYLRMKQQLNQVEISLYRSFRLIKKKKDIMAEQNESSRNNTVDVNLIKPRSPFVDKSLSKLFKVATLISVSGLTYSVVVIYALVTMLLNTSVVMEAWPWLAYQTVARLAECGMVIGMSYLVRRPYFKPCKKSTMEENTSAVV